MSNQSFTVDGVCVPRFLYGTAWKEQATQRLVQLAIQQGFRGVDTANQVAYNDIWQYDPMTNAWTQLSATLSLGRGYIATEALVHMDDAARLYQAQQHQQGDHRAFNASRAASIIGSRPASRAAAV